MTEYSSETLDEVIQSHAADWTPETCRQIVLGLRELSERWNAEQLAGSRKLVRTKNVPSTPQGKINIAFKDLKL